MQTEKFMTDNLSPVVRAYVMQRITSDGATLLYDAPIKLPSGDYYALVVIVGKECSEGLGYHIMRSVYLIYNDIPVTLMERTPLFYRGDEPHFPTLFSAANMLGFEVACEHEQREFDSTASIEEGTPFYNMLTEHYPKELIYPYCPIVLGLLASSAINLDKLQNISTHLGMFFDDDDE